MKTLSKIFHNWYAMTIFLALEWSVHGIAWAADTAHNAEAAASSHSGLYAIAAAAAIAIAAFGGAVGQGRVGAAAMEGIARNPQAQKIMFIPMIIVLALIESFVIFSLAIAMIIVGKI